MMSRTHVSMGIATALFAMHPTTPKECFIGIVGGAIGGIVCDIDTVKKDYQNDAHTGQYLAFGIACFVLLLDYFLKTGICSSVISDFSSVTVVGILLFLVLYIKGYFSSHRTFTHSIMALLLMTISIALIHPQIATAFFFGFISHLLLDLLNKKGIRILYPLKKEVCLNLCYASKTTNSILLIVGITGSVFLLFNGLFIHAF